MARRRVTVVEVERAKFFDRVNHDLLTSWVSRHLRDPRVLKLIRRYLESGVVVEGVALARAEGTPPSGPLSPPLCNILIDDVVKALEASASCFVRYADDLNVHVRSVRAGEWMQTRLRRLAGELRLQINEVLALLAEVAGAAQGPCPRGDETDARSQHRAGGGGPW